MPYSPKLPFAGMQNLNAYDTVMNHQLETVVQAFDPVYGDAELVYMAMPTSTALAVGTIVTKVATSLTNVPTLNLGNVTVANGSVATAMPTGAANTAQAVYVVINPLSSSATRQFGWVLKYGQFPVLKTAVTVPSGSRCFISGTAGRFYVTASAGKTLQGMRTANTASVTSTTSTVLCNITNPMIQGA